MYKNGEYVIYGSKGVCQVGEVTTLKLDNIPKDRQYYVLFPKNNGGTNDIVNGVTSCLQYCR